MWYPATTLAEHQHLSSFYKVSKIDILQCYSHTKYTNISILGISIFGHTTPGIYTPTLQKAVTTGSEQFMSLKFDYDYYKPVQIFDFLG